MYLNQASQILCVPERDIQRCGKILLSNLNNFFFSRHFKKILNGQKLDDISIFQLLKFCGDSSKTVINVLFVFIGY